MMRTFFTPRSSERLFISPRYFRSLPLSLKNWLTYSTASMPYSSLETLAKSRLFSFPPNSARWSDHWAREILNQGCCASAALSVTQDVRLRPTAAKADRVRNSRRLVLPFIGQGDICSSERALVRLPVWPRPFSLAD